MAELGEKAQSLLEEGRLYAKRGEKKKGPSTHFKEAWNGLMSETARRPPPALQRAG